MKSILVAWVSSLLVAIPLAPLAQGEPEAQDKAGVKLAEADRRYHDAKTVAQARYRKDLAEAIAAAGRIEIFLLSPVWIETLTKDSAWATRLPEDEFPILAYGGKTKIKKRAVLTPEQRAEFVPALQKILGGTEPDGLLCHDPIHGIRVFSGEEIIFQTSICWRCHNYGVGYPDNKPQFEGLSGSEDLQKLFEKLMPIPEEMKK